MADRFMVKWQSDLVYTMENMVPVGDKRYHIYNRFRHLGRGLRNCGTIHSFKLEPLKQPECVKIIYI